MWQSSSFLDNLEIAINAAKATVSTIKTYTDKLGRTYSVNHHTDRDSYSCSRDCDGFYIIPACDSLVCVIYLCDLNGLTEVKAQEEAVVEAPVVVEAPAIVAQIVAVDSIDAQIEELQARLIALQTEKDEINAAIDSQIAQGLDTIINGHNVKLVSTINKINVLNIWNGMQNIRIISGSRLVVREVIKAMSQESNFSVLGDTLKDKYGASLFCDMGDENLSLLVCQNEISIFHNGCETALTHAQKLSSLDEMTTWIKTWIVDFQDCDFDDILDMCISGGAEMVHDEVEEYDDHENGWKIWE